MRTDTQARTQEHNTTVYKCFRFPPGCLFLAKDPPKNPHIAFSYLLVPNLEKTDAQSMFFIKFLCILVYLFIVLS